MAGHRGALLGSRAVGSGPGPFPGARSRDFSGGTRDARAVGERAQSPSAGSGRTQMVQAIQDQWAIVAAVVVLIAAAIVWIYARQ